MGAVGETARRYGRTMDAAQIERIKASYASLQPQWEKVINRCFDRLFVRAPALKDLYPSNMDPVRREYARVIALLVEKADRLHEVEEMLRDLGKRHRGYGAEAAHYPLLRDALVAGMKDVAGKGWDYQVEFAWKAFMNEIAKAMHYGKVEGSAPGAADASAAAPPPAEAAPATPDQAPDAGPPTGASDTDTGGEMPPPSA